MAKLVPIRTIGALGAQHGEAVRIDGYPGRCRTVNTISVRSTTHVGEVRVEASMALEPQDDDWRVVHTFTFTEAPRTLGTVLRGKFVWLRFVYDDEDGGHVDTALVR